VLSYLFLSRFLWIKVYLFLPHCHLLIVASFSCNYLNLMMTFQVPVHAIFKCECLYIMRLLFYITSRVLWHVYCHYDTLQRNHDTIQHNYNTLQCNYDTHLYFSVLFCRIVWNQRSKSARKPVCYLSLKCNYDKHLYYVYL